MDEKMRNEIDAFINETDKVMEIGDNFHKALKENNISNTMALSLLATNIDRYCFEHGLDENETWDALYEFHKQVNAECGNYKEETA